jgi:glycosyl transferase family 25
MASWSIDSIPAFCITLDRRQDRWRRFQDQSGIEGLDVKRFLGVDGKTLDVNDSRITTLTRRNIITKSRRSHEELDTIGGVGCALSHIAVWQWLVDNNQEMVLVFEDDAVVPTDFIERANGCIDRSMILKDPKKWDMWLLGGKWEDLTKIPGESEAVRADAFVLFHAYIITKRCAKRLLQDVYPIHCHIDIWVSIYAHLNDLRLVGCPKLILDQTQRVKTDIQPDKTCHICNVPTDYEKQYKMVSKLEWNVAQVAEVLCVGLIGYILYQHFLRKSAQKI